MGTTAQKLQAIANSKAAIKSAIEAKGVSDVGNVLSTYATKIASIPSGGSSGDIRYEVSEQGALSKKSFAVNWFNDVTSIPNNGLEYAYYKNNVTSVSFPNLTSVGNNGLYNAFNGCTSLTSVDLSSLTSVGNDGLTYAFSGCTSLTSLNLPSLSSVGQYGLQFAFRGCTSLTSVSFPSLTSISTMYGRELYNAFNSCTSLTSVDLSSLTSVGNDGLGYAFQNCTSLTTVLLKKLSSASSAFSYTFHGCTALELVDFSEATAVPALNSTSAFLTTNNYYRIVVPNALYNQWIAATNWSDPSIVTHIEKAIKALTFTAESANSTISLDSVGTPTSIDIEYSTDGGATFSPYTVGTTITLTSVNDTVMFRAGSTGQTALADDSSNYHKFVMTGSISLEDDVSYLLNKNAVPATTALADYAFYGLFKGCASLQNAPELPWTTMGEGCYGEMFKGCTSITEAPTLPATTLATGCYNEMFYGCSSLNYISLGYTGNFSTTYFNDWVYGVASEGNFMYQGADTTRGTSAIPSGWQLNEWTYDGLTFTSEQDGSTVKLVKNSGAPDVYLDYTTDSMNWQTYTVGTPITLNNGDKVGFIARTTNNTFGNNSNTQFNGWVGTGQLSVSGNINSLLDKDNYATLTDISSRQRVFNWMFSNMTSLVSAEDLELPCTAIGKFAYNNMFDGCTNLTKAPKEIAAVTISTTGDWPMAGMFKNTAITKSPYLHFTTTNTSNAYQEMFSGCSNLNEIKLDYTGNFGTGAFTDWVKNVAASGTFYYNGSDTTRGTNAIPSGWTITPFVTYKNYINTNIAEMNTGVIPTTDTKVVGRFRGSAVGNLFVGSSDAKWRGFNSQNTFYLDLNGMSARISQSGWDTTKWYDVEYGNFYFNCVPVDGGTTISQSNTARSFTHTTSLILGSATYSWAGEYEQFDCAGFKIYEGNTLVKDYRPAVDGNGVACFHEEVSGTYAYPSSGTFLAY